MKFSSKFKLLKKNMRRQRFFSTLSSHDDSVLTTESEDASINSSQFSISDSTWSQIFPLEHEPLAPCCIYQYPYLHLTSEPFLHAGGIVGTMYTPDCRVPLDNYCCFENDYLDSCEYMSSPLRESFEEDYAPEECNAEDKDYFTENVQCGATQILNSYPMVTNYGAVSILLRHLIRVDISPDKGIYLTNPPASCVATINGFGNKCGLIHPNGRVFYDGADIHMKTLNRKAKMCRRGIVFTSKDHCLSYLVDASGTKTTSEKFQDLAQDFTLEVFYCRNMTSAYPSECYNMVEDSTYKRYRNGDEMWLVGGFRIKQDQWGEVKITHKSGRRVIRSSPTNGLVGVKSGSVEVSINRYPSNYFSVKHGEKQVTASLGGFNVQNGTQKAGFNSSGKVVLF